MFLYLCKGHRASNCTGKNGCNICNGAHHGALYDASKVHYLPHQAVIRKDAVTTKVRVVYDALSKECKSRTSLM
jgi:hypothetical protein